MPFRFRKRLRLFPGFWLNVSKSGVSASVERRGATINVSPKGHQESVGLPGLGLELQGRRGKKLGKPGAPAAA
jgi:hypothetical protein